MMGAEVHGLALEPQPDGHFQRSRTAECLETDHRGDIRDQLIVESALARAKPEVLFHLAAQALVLEGYDHPVDTIATNVLGTAHVLQACRDATRLRAIVVVTTDKCYQNDGGPWAMRETDALGGDDPYSSSKACTELISAMYGRSYLSRNGVRLATARAGNVIGGGDRGKNRLFSDLISALSRDEPFELRNPGAIRPWQHVLDALRGYALLAQALFEDHPSIGSAYNFAPDESKPWTADQIVSEAFAQWGGAPHRKDAQPDCTRPEAMTLKLDASLARRDLGWRARLNTAQAVKWTVEWERSVKTGEPADRVTKEQINRMMSESGELNGPR